MEGAVYIKKMLGAQVCTTTTRVLSPYRGEEIGTDDELSVLPRHTKVVVTGNNRTKSVLVGLQGVVKKAVGLGGWHWLVLPQPTTFDFQWPVSQSGEKIGSADLALSWK
ncbi:hypothetical protein MKW94_000068 [Papaver nudicaule]|uniref:Uncharacterized protein n=1 Tax=Papaver nudicaule TaxID=74823 RepID=A0AA41UX25_PAPNU|nr:hypothetical protein [Papaver nudicaule]